MTVGLSALHGENALVLRHNSGILSDWIGSAYSDHLELSVKCPD